METNLKKCRTCLSESQVLIPMSAYSIASGNALKMCDVFMTCASIQIKPNDGFSQYACSGCVIAAEKAFLFRRQCEKTDKIWHSLKGSTVNIKSEIIQEENNIEESVTECIILDVVKNEEPKTSKEIVQKADIKKDLNNIFNKDKEKDETGNFNNIKKYTPSATSHTSIRYQCYMCLKWYSRVEGLQTHMRIYHGKSNKQISRRKVDDTNFKRMCKICFEEIGIITDYDKHKHGEVELSNILIYRCKKCQEDFNNLKDARVHWRISHIERVVKRVPPKFPRHCLFCPTVVKDYKDNELHINKFHSEFKRYTCSMCPKTFLKQSLLSIHEEIHRGKKNYICQYCGRGFSNSVNLVSHVRIHTGEKPYRCDICNAAFAQSGSLRSHKLNHTSEKNYECDLCQLRFRRPNTLRLHRRRHTGVKPYKCDVCTKSFTTSGSRKKHMLTHTGERNFVCQDCNKAFSRACNLKVHRRIHTGEKPHLCSECGKGFIQAHCLRSHMKTRHNITIK